MRMNIDLRVSAALWPASGASSRCVGSDHLTQRTLAFVLAGGRGTRLGELTDYRAKPAVPFGSRFRIIDFTLANCVNSDLRHIAVLTQYKAQSLIRHIQHNWSLDRRFGEFIEVVPAQQRLGNGWYVGTANAVFQNIDLIEKQGPDFVLILGGDHVYKMDYSKLLAEHRAKQADVTVACVEVPLEQASSFGVLEVDAARRVTAWEEKPRTPRPMPGRRNEALASMGIYVFNTEALLGALCADAQDCHSLHDFGHDLIPELVRGGFAVYAHSFGDSCVGTPGREPYWRDVGTLDAYWDANIELTSEHSSFDLFDPSWPIPATSEFAIPSRFQSDGQERLTMLSETLIGTGCTIGAAAIHRSVIFSGVRIGHNALIGESVLLPQTEIGAGATLRRVIVDKHCRLPEGLVAGFDAEHDRRRFHVTQRGVVLITPEMLGQEVRSLTGLQRGVHHADRQMYLSGE
jgi:glucose-1-phosphate adenylyltransferase